MVTGRLLGALVGVAAVAAMPAAADDPLKIGFVGTLTGAGATIGRDVLSGFQLVLGQTSERLGNIEVEMRTADDAHAPDKAVLAVQRLLAQGARLFVLASATPAANEAAAAAALAGNAFVLAASESPQPLARARCNPQFFSLTPYADAEHVVMARYFADVGYGRVWVAAPESERGRSAAAAFAAAHAGQIAGGTYSKPGTMSFVNELLVLGRAADNLDAAYMLLTGGMGVAYARQYAERGLDRRVALFAPGSFLDHPHTVAASPAIVDAIGVSSWVEDLDNPVNQRFVGEFEQRYNRPPSVYGAFGYDAGLLLDSALRVAAQNTAAPSRVEAMRDALRRAEFQSPRGYFRFGTNHFPAQNWYLHQVAFVPKGRIGNEMRQIVLKEFRDPGAAECPMRWDDPLAPPPPPPPKKKEPPRPAPPARR